MQDITVKQQFGRNDQLVIVEKKDDGKTYGGYKTARGDIVLMPKLW